MSPDAWADQDWQSRAETGRDLGGRRIGERVRRVSTCDFCDKPISYHYGSGKWNHVDTDDAANCPAARAQPKGWLDG